MHASVQTNGSSFRGFAQNRDHQPTAWPNSESAGRDNKRQAVRRLSNASSRLLFIDHCECLIGRVVGPARHWQHRGRGVILRSASLLMQLSDQFRLDVPLEDASWACREAVVSLDWPLLESIEPHRLVLKKGVRIATGSLSSIEVLLSEADSDATIITLNGKFPWGIGRRDERTLRSLMNSVRNAIEVAARRPPEQG